MGMNVGSFMACALKFKPMLSASGGNIVMLSSIASLMAIPGAPAYCASKFAVTGSCRSLARGWAAETVRVNALGPGVIPSHAARPVHDNPKYSEAVTASNPMRLPGLAEQIAQTPLFHAAPLAATNPIQTIAIHGTH